MNLSIESIGKLIRKEALRLGFSDVGFSPAKELIEDKQRLAVWLNKGYNANMAYMANNFEKRVNAALLQEGTKSVISLVTNYYPKNDSLSKSILKISRYAYGKDYHDVIRNKLNLLFDFIKHNINSELQGRVFVDSAPLLERALAVKAGLGWIGKSGMFIHPEYGSYVFLSEILVNIQLPHSISEVNNKCGNCTRCIDACPTNAILPNKQIDSNACISYQTIENKEAIPQSLKEKMKGWIYGCDICQEVCPWNKKAVPTEELEFAPTTMLSLMKNEEWEALTQEQFSALFKGSAVKRTKYSGLKRNIDFLKSPY